MAALACLAFVALARPHGLAAQLHGQHWDVTPNIDRVTVGDTVTLAFRVRLDERDLLFDTVPRPATPPPHWLRIFSIEKLQRQPDRIYVGHARIAFYRPGRQATPIFQLPFMRSVKGLSRGTLSSDSATIEVVPVVTDASSATLRDIKEARDRRPTPLIPILALATLAAAGYLTWRARRRRPAPATAPIPVAAEPAPRPPDPYVVALERLEAIERERWADRDVAHHYDAVTAALRDYLEAHGVPARERTTTELRWALPPGFLAGGIRHRFTDVFDEGDLVKFARRRPEAAVAADYVGRARDLLGRWHDAAGAGEAADAIR
jgi:hypothetical protein